VLRAALQHRLGEFTLECELEADPAATLVLVGESGSGKSTVLRLLAGLLRPAVGRIALGDAVWCESPGGPWLPPDRRPVGFVPQDYALFPHLDVAENIGFGLRARGDGRRDVRRRTAALLERFELTALAHRRPAQLSGGQQQRVALARALAVEPALLLLDEPLAALDVETRQAVRTELRRLLAGLSCITVLVTHAPMEALLFGDRIAVLEGGRLVQSGDGLSLLREPRSRYVATLLGLNLLPGRVTGRGPGEELHLATPRGPVTVLQPSGADELFVVVRPDQVVLSLEAPTASARNVFPGVVQEVLPEPPFGDRVRVVLGPGPAFVAEVSATAAAALGLEPGTAVFASFKATSISAYA
jgi:molybdate transport system ATP-binding protein